MRYGLLGDFPKEAWEGPQISLMFNLCILLTNFLLGAFVFYLFVMHLVTYTNSTEVEVQSVYFIEIQVILSCSWRNLVFFQGKQHAFKPASRSRRDVQALLMACVAL